MLEFPFSLSGSQPMVRQMVAKTRAGQKILVSLVNLHSSLQNPELQMQLMKIICLLDEILQTKRHTSWVDYLVQLDQIFNQAKQKLEELEKNVKKQAIEGVSIETISKAEDLEEEIKSLLDRKTKLFDELKHLQQAISVTKANKEKVDNRYIAAFKGLRRVFSDTKKKFSGGTSKVTFEGLRQGGSGIDEFKDKTKGHFALLIDKYRKRHEVLSGSNSPDIEIRVNVIKCRAIGMIRTTGFDLELLIELIVSSPLGPMARYCLHIPNLTISSSAEVSSEYYQLMDNFLDRELFLLGDKVRKKEQTVDIHAIIEDLFDKYCGELVKKLE